MRGPSAFLVVAALAAACASQHHAPQIVVPSQTGASLGQPNQSQTCDLPRSDPLEAIFAVSAYEGSALSPVALGDVDTLTQVIDVDIAPGDRKIYFVGVTYNAMIWRFTGAVERLSSAVLISEMGAQDAPSAGAVGLPREVVHVFHANLCTRYVSDLRAQSPNLDAWLQGRIGRNIDAGILAYDLAGLRIERELQIVPTNPRRPPPPAGFDPDVWQIALRFAPNGVAQGVTASDVIGGRAQAYETLPQAFGLAQLTSQGALGLLPRSEWINFLPTFSVRRQFKYPVGLYGAHSVAFMRGRGAPKPFGSPGHSCILDREAGEKFGPTC